MANSNIHKEKSTLNNNNTTFSQICNTQLLDTSIEDVSNIKKTLVSKYDSLMMLMREVEGEEKAAEEANEEVFRGCSDIIEKVYKLIRAQRRIKKENDMLVTETNVHKDVIATNMEGLQLRVASMMDKGDRSLQVLDEMRRTLEMRLTSAVEKKKLAVKKKQENEAVIRETLLYEEKQTGKLVEESKRLKQEALTTSKLLEFVIGRSHEVDMLHGEISNKFQDVTRLKEELDKAIQLGGILPQPATHVASRPPPPPPPPPTYLQKFHLPTITTTRTAAPVQLYHHPPPPPPPPPSPPPPLKPLPHSHNHGGRTPTPPQPPPPPPPPPPVWRSKLIRFQETETRSDGRFQGFSSSRAWGKYSVFR